MLFDASNKESSCTQQITLRATEKLTLDREPKCLSFVSMWPCEPSGSSEVEKTKMIHETWDLNIKWLLNWVHIAQRLITIHSFYQRDEEVIRARFLLYGRRFLVIFHAYKSISPYQVWIRRNISAGKVSPNLVRNKCVCMSQRKGEGEGVEPHLNTKSNPFFTA